MKIKYLAIPNLAVSLLLTGCGQNDDDQNIDFKDKQEQKKKDKKSEKKTRNKDSNNESNTENTQSTNNEVANQD